MNIQWYPGHMTKAKRMMEENIKLIDLVIELLDARIPVSSKNPDIDTLSKGKARLIILNKADLADEKATNEWIDYYKSQGINAVKVNSRMKNFTKQVNEAILKSSEAIIARNLKRGIKNKPIRALLPIGRIKISIPTKEATAPILIILLSPILSETKPESNRPVIIPPKYTETHLAAVSAPIE